MRVSRSTLWACASLLSASVAFGTPSIAIAFGPIGGEPCTGVSLSAGASIQDIVDANPAGTTFCLDAGTYSQQSVVPKDGDQFIGAFGAVLDGENSIEHAFSGSASNVVIRNLRIINYRTRALNGFFSDAPVHGDTTDSWTVERNEIAYNWGAGLDIGRGMRVAGNAIHHNAQIGIDTNFTADVDPTAVFVDVVIDGNEIAFNNYRHDFDPGWEAGGTKFWGTTNLQVTNNYAHDNIGPGLWTDTDNIGTLYANNVVENNTGGGIEHEVSYDAVIRDNLLKNNGWIWIYGWLYQPQILLNTSGGAPTTGGQIEITGNTVISGPNGGGVGLEQQDRSTDHAAYGAHIVQNVFVHDNSVDLSSAIYQPSAGGVFAPQNGGVEDDGEHLIYTSRNNRFVNDTYYLGSETLAAHAFDWIDDDTVGVAAWTGYGNDTTGAFNYAAMSIAPAAYLVSAPSDSPKQIAAESLFRLGRSVTLIWSSTSTTSCTGDGFSTGGAIGGSVTIVPSAATTYGVTCTGPNGSASSSTTVRLDTRACAAAKLKAAGKEVAGKMICEQRAKATATSADPACLAAAQAKAETAIDKVEDGCPGTAAAIHDAVDDCVSGFVADDPGDGACPAASAKILAQAGQRELGCQVKELKKVGRFAKCDAREDVRTKGALATAGGCVAPESAVADSDTCLRTIDLIVEPTASATPTPAPTP